MKARIEHFRKEAENKLPPLLPQEPLIKVRQNRHPPFFGEVLEYMREFHKKNSANNLYGLPKTCQEFLDLALTGHDAEQIIQKWLDLGMKTRFQHICEASVLGFDVDPYPNLNPADFLFSLDDLQYLRHHFEVFSASRLKKLRELKDWTSIWTHMMLASHIKSRFSRLCKRRTKSHH